MFGHPRRASPLLGKSPTGRRDMIGQQLFHTPAVVRDARPQPQAGAHHQRHRHPDHPALPLDPDLIGLHFPQFPLGRDDEVFMHRLTLRSRLLLPVPDGALIQAEGRACLCARRRFCHRPDSDNGVPSANESRCCPHRPALRRDSLGGGKIQGEGPCLSSFPV